MRFVMGGVRSFLAVTVALSLVHMSAHADEPQRYLKMTCIPELHYMEVTTVFSEETLDDDVRRKYNLLTTGEFECSIGGRRITLNSERTTWNSAAEAGLLRDDRWSPDLDINHAITVLADGIALVTVSDFGTWSYEDDGVQSKFPHILTFDGLVVNVCTGLLVRECKVIKP
jgi:hypothetical protein